MRVELRSRIRSSCAARTPQSETDALPTTASRVSSFIEKAATDHIRYGQARLRSREGLGERGLRQPNSIDGQVFANNGERSFSASANWGHEKDNTVSRLR